MGIIRNIKNFNMTELSERFVTYLSQFEYEIPQSYLIKLARDNGYKETDITIALIALASHEYVVREEWKDQQATFQFVRELVEHNRKYHPWPKK